LEKLKKAFGGIKFFSQKKKNDFKKNKFSRKNQSPSSLKTEKEKTQNLKNEK